MRCSGTPRRTSSCGSGTATGRTSCTGASPARRSDYPSGHAEGFPDTFKQLYRAVYRAVEAGRMPDDAAEFPTFRDGHEGVVLGEAIAASAREGRWIEVPA